jgi:hypothetical protein
MKYRGNGVPRLTWPLALALFVSTLAAAQNTPERWTAKDLKQAISTAKTADDHKQIAQYYIAKAARAESEAKEHEELAEIYRKSPNLHEQKHPMSPETAGHCQWLAERNREIAQKNRDLARMHEDMAKSLSQ